MKKTMVVYPNSHQHKIIDALMADIKFEEVDRVITGGHMNSEQLCITYEGNANNYHENGYVEIPQQHGLPKFYSISMPDGGNYRDVESFKQSIKMNEISIEIKQFNSL